MNLPTSLKIGGHIITVSYDLNDDENNGKFDWNKNHISIGKDLPQDQKEAVLIHEIFHAMNSTLDHELLDSLAEQWYQVIKDNKLL